MFGSTRTDESFLENNNISIYFSIFSKVYGLIFVMSQRAPIPSLFGDNVLSQVFLPSGEIVS